MPSDNVQQEGGFSQVSLSVFMINKMSYIIKARTTKFSKLYSGYIVIWYIQMLGTLDCSLCSCCTLRPLEMVRKRIYCEVIRYVKSYSMLLNVTLVSIHYIVDIL